MDDLFALVDCNNFYASCERVFNPRLKDKPIVVLSNNDGCVIARSNEAKILGIEMGRPFFECRSFIKSHKLQAFSSNYPLYGDMSHRVMSILQEYEDHVEVYSIDEAFILLPNEKFNRTEWALRLKSLIQQYTGIPVSIGIGRTKTLAKVANKLAKKHSHFKGVMDSTKQLNLDSLLSKIEVRDLWGIGPNYAKLLERNRINTVLELKNADDSWIRQNLTVFGLRTVLELRGIPCISFDEIPVNKKSICRGRSFGRPIKTLKEMEEALATYTSRAAEKMRSQNLVATQISVFITTNRFKENEPQYSNSLTVPLPVQTAFTPELIKHSLLSLRRIFKRGYYYKKCGVMLLGLIPRIPEQLGFFDRYEEKQEILMGAIDQVNKRWGYNSIQYAVAGTKKPWIMRQANKSPAYTTKWSEIPIVKASF